MQKEKIDLILLEKLKTEKPNQDIKSSHIREALKDVQASRRVDNKRNTAAYFKMIKFLSKRHKKENELPQDKEIAMLEVFKKLTESGWIVKLPEFKQILEFCQIDFVNTPHREHNKLLKKFVEQFAQEIGIEAKNEIEQLIGIERRPGDPLY